MKKITSLLFFLFTFSLLNAPDPTNCILKPKMGNMVVELLRKRSK